MSSAQPERAYSTTDAALLADTDLATLRFWVRRGLVRPTYGYGGGSGKHWRWTRQDVMCVRLILQIRRLCESQEVVRGAVIAMQAAAPEDLWVFACRLNGNPVAETFTLLPPTPIPNCVIAFVVDIRTLEAGL